MDMNQVRGWRPPPKQTAGVTLAARSIPHAAPAHQRASLPHPAGRTTGTATMSSVSTGCGSQTAVLSTCDTDPAATSHFAGVTSANLTHPASPGLRLPDAESCVKFMRRIAKATGDGFAQEMNLAPGVWT